MHARNVTPSLDGPVMLGKTNVLVMRTQHAA
jgi:hypothetical protein